MECMLMIGDLDLVVFLGDMEYGEVRFVVLFG